MKLPSALLSPDTGIDEMPSPTGAKTLVLLDLLSRHGAGLTVAEATRRSGFTQNLVFRLLKTLVLMGYATQREDSKAYVLTHRLLELTGPRQGDRSLALCAHEALRRLRDETGETVQLVVEAGGKGLVLEQFRGSHPLQVCGEVGMRVPLYSCAPGKAILASWGEEKRAEWFRGRGRKLKKFTATTLARREDLLRELDSVARQGYAVDRAEGVEGIHCVAVAILGEYCQPVGAVTVMAPIHRMPGDAFPRVAEQCREAAVRIELKLKE
jgi:DNA-binding IclR family transcriptional regulator